MEQSVNNVLMLKTFVDSIKPVWQALTGAASEELQKIRQVCCSILAWILLIPQLCDPQNYGEIEALIQYALNDDVTYASHSTELRNQRVYAIRVCVMEQFLFDGLTTGGRSKWLSGRCPPDLQRDQSRRI